MNTTQMTLLGRRRYAVMFLVVLAFLSVVLTLSLNTQRTEALSGSEFNAGRIIDDGVFFNSSTMSASQIQAFMDSKVPVCDTNHTKSSDPDDSGPPYTCLKDYRQDTTNIAPESGLCAGYTGASNESSATIIYKVAQSCGINPKVLLVMLQKEQSLITDSWPWTIQYDKAMGAFCPDTEPCNSQYKGFFYQVYYGAHRFKVYAANPNSFNYKAGRNNTIYYHPGPCQTYTNGVCTKYYGNKYDINGKSIADITYCGSSTVFIQNQATANLYIYTPYQPNAAALSPDSGPTGLYGVGDLCSAYGNRNFWRMFSDWFGSTQTNIPYAWSLVTQESYGNPERTNPVNTSVLAPEQVVYLRIKARNAGYKTWSNTGPGAVKIGTNNQRERISGVCTESWVSCSRPATLIESSVAPGNIGTFEFPIKAQGWYGDTKEYFNLLAEGETWMNDQGMYWQLNVKPPTFVWDYKGQAAYADTSKTRPINPGMLATNTSYYLVLKARNTGNANWTNSGTNPINLGASSQTDRQSQFCNSTWLNCARPTRLKESLVKPGEVGTFEFQVTSPTSLGSFKEHFRPVVEGVGWMNDLGAHWQLNIMPATYEWQQLSQSLYTDSARTSPITAGQTVANNSIVYARLSAVNTGNVTWHNSGNNPVNIGASSPKDRSSSFCDSSWLNCTRPSTLKESSVAPGEVGTFEFSVKTPHAENGSAMREYFTPLSEGKNWMNDVGMYYQFNFNSPLDTWQYVNQATYSNSSYTQLANTSSLTRNTTYYLQLKAKNTSGQTWNRITARLGTSNPQDRNSVFCNSTWLSCNRAAVLKESSVSPGQVGTFEFSITTPSDPGNYSEYFRPLVEGQFWLTDIGLYWQFVVI